jgi:hypothetical protein
MASNPIGCHLWRIDDMSEEELRAALEQVENVADESHLTETLYRCKACGQLYFDIWYELLDWETGDDTSYEIYVPVADSDEIERLKQLKPPPISLDFLSIVPRLQRDATGASCRFRWVRNQA